jgi:prepilin peptidase CpaA
MAGLRGVCAALGRLSEQPNLARRISVMLAACILLCLTAVVFAACIFAAVTDVRELRVPNALSLIVIGAFVLGIVVSPDSFGKWWSHLGAFTLVFGVTFAMFAVGMMGGGDTKLASALALWIGLKTLALYLFWMAAMGGVLGVAALLIRKRRPFRDPPSKSWIAAIQGGGSQLPYAVAISFGAWAALLQNGFISHQIDEVIKIIH